MFARIITIPLKPGSKLHYAKAHEKTIIPLLRTHEGFRDVIACVSADGNTGIGISFWDSRENAEAYSRSGFSDVMKALEPVATGPAQVQPCDVTNSTAHKIAVAAGA